jgi:hypothetical protein
LKHAVIQGTVDADPTGKLSQNEVATTVEFCFKAFSHVTPEQKEAVVNKLKSLGVTEETGDNDEAIVKALGEIEKSLTPEEAQVLDILRSRRMIREDGFNMDSFTLDAIDGLAPRMERGNLGLAKAVAAKLNKSHMYSMDFLEGKRPGFRAQEATSAADGTNGHTNGHANGHTNGHANGQEHGSMNGNTKATSGANGSINGPNGNGDSHGPLKGVSEQVTAGIFTPPINGHASLLDDVGRHAVMTTLHEAAENLETPFDFVMRLGNTVSCVPLPCPLPK